MSDLPVTVIGGYLGAGKTTLINQLLRHANGLRLAVLVNEFGALSIDEDLIEAQDEDIISIAGGCICCSFGNDLTAALGDLSRLPQPPDHILIESSGVAIPGAIIASLQLVSGFTPDGIVVLADAETIQRLASDTYLSDTIQRQLVDADIVVLNKVDLVEPSELAELHTWFESTAAKAKVIATSQARVPLDAVLGCGPEQKVVSAGTHADALFDRFGVECVSAVDVGTMAERLATGPYGIVRAKGFLRDDQGTRLLLHIVGHRWSVTPAPEHSMDGVVFIGLKSRLDVDGIRRLLQENVTFQ